MTIAAPPTTALRATVAAALCALALAGAAGAAQAAPIYSCIDGGKRLTSDRPIAECRGREQRVLNADGSLREILPPTLTAEERANLEQRERENAVARAERQDAVRRDRNLLARYPNAAVHEKAREAALDDVRKSMRMSELRLAALSRDRKPLLDETEFYVGKPLPGKLRAQLDANDASTEAQRTLIQNQQIELVRVSKLYDIELERLRKLWAGAEPGSMGVLAAAPSPPRTPSK